MDNLDNFNGGVNTTNTTPKQGKTILVIIAVVFIALFGGGLIFG